METKNQMLKILPFNFLNFSDSSVSFSSKSESYKFFPSKQIFGIWAWAVGTGGLLMGLIMWSNVPPIIPKCYTKKFFDFQKIHFYILPVSYFRLMLILAVLGILPSAISGYFCCKNTNKSLFFQQKIWWNQNRKQLALNHIGLLLVSQYYLKLYCIIFFSL